MVRLNLKMAIVTSGKSQREIAAACRISENRFSEIVRGWTDPTVDERNAIASMLAWPAQGLFDEGPRAA